MTDPAIEQKCEELFGKYIENGNWIFAKTAIKNPHWYIVRRHSLSQQMFSDFVTFIRANGYKEMFWKKEYTCLNYKGNKYWSMGNPVEETTIINRCPVQK